MSNQITWNRLCADGAAQLSVVAMGAVRVSLLFGSAAVALALITVPAESDHRGVQISGAGLTKVLDRIHTSAIPLR